MDATTNDDVLDPNSGIVQALMRQPNYINPAYTTPEQLAALRLQAEKYQTLPEAKSWTGAIAQALGAVAANANLSRATALEQAQGASAHQARMFGAGAGIPGASSAGSMPTASAGRVDPQSLVSTFAGPLGPAGAAGLVGNWGAESAYSPTASGDKGHAVGLAQWNDRAPTLNAYAAKHGASPADANVQKQFALVEMGLAGSPSDPGFGTERAAGQALQAARTPQQATAAALMYERPQGFSAAHPENSHAYSKRLALVSALMGGRGGAGASPMAYAPSAGNAGAMPPVGPGAGTAVPLGAAGGAGTAPMAAGPYQAPAGPNVMAQNAPQPQMAPGGVPVQGSKAYADYMSNRGISDAEKRSMLIQQQPEMFTDATGGVHLARPNLTRAGQLAPGNLSSNITPQSVTANQPTVGGLPSGPTIYPGSGGQAPAAGSSPSPATAGGNGAMPTTVEGWQEYFRKQSSLEGANTEMGKAAVKVPQYRGALSTLDLADKAADNLDDVGTWTKLKAFAQEKTGLPLGDNLSSLDTFRSLVNNLQTLLPPGVSGISPEILGKLETTPDGRHQIIANLKSMLQYGLELGQVGGKFGEMSTEDRWKKYQSMQPPQPKWSLPDKAQTASGGGSGGGASAPGGPPPGVPADAKKAPDGNWYSPDPKRPGKYVKWQ